MSHEINVTQEVEEILKQLDEFRLRPQAVPNQTISSPPESLIGNFSAVVSPSSRSSSGEDQDHHSSSSISSVDEDDRYAAEKCAGESKEHESADPEGKHLQLQGARHFLDPSLFVTRTGGAFDDTRKAAQMLENAHLERERVRTWAEKMRKAVDRWVREQTKATAISVRTLEDQLAEALGTCRKQAEIIKQLESEVDGLKQTAKFEKQTTTIQEPTFFQTPEHHHGKNPVISSHPPPTVSPASPLSEKSRNGHGQDSTRSSPTFYDRLECASHEKSPEKRRKRRFQKSEGCQVIEYSNGATREVYADHEVLRHRNQDIEIIYPDHRRYYYAESKTLRITDSTKTAYYYSNSQSEIHWNDGRKLIRFADGSMHSVCGRNDAATI